MWRFFCLFIISFDIQSHFTLYQFLFRFNGNKLSEIDCWKIKRNGKFQPNKIQITNTKIEDFPTDSREFQSCWHWSQFSSTEISIQQKDFSGFSVHFHIFSLEFDEYSLWSQNIRRIYSMDLYVLANGFNYCRFSNCTFKCGQNVHLNRWLCIPHEFMWVKNSNYESIVYVFHTRIYLFQL